MTLNSQLVHLVENFRQQHKEGVYWDFKQQYHKNNGELLLDLICMANAEHEGSRYIIFGIEDSTMDFLCLSRDPYRKKQSDIIAFLKDNANKFADSQYPEITIHTVKISDAQIDILIVNEAKKKPIYLIERIGPVGPFQIYTRVGDTNTQRDKSASPSDVERMWRHRFGLNKTAYQRAKQLLLNFTEWETDTDKNGNATWYHKIFPEFTIRVGDHAGGAFLEWTQGEVRKDDNYSSSYELFYHQTRLACIQCVTFDNLRKSMVAPEWEWCGDGRLYYYEKDSIKHAMQLFHANSYREDHSKSLTTSGNFQIPITNKDEIKQFIESNPEFKKRDICTNDEQNYAIYIKNIKSFFEWKEKKN